MNGGRPADDLRIIIDFPWPQEGPSVRRDFRDPVRVIQADTLDDVVPAMLAVERAAHEGQWCAGFVSYEAAPAFEPPMRVRPEGRMPLLLFGVFDDPGVTTPAQPSTRAPANAASWEEQTSAAEFNAAIAVIHEAIAAGETYQVNYTNRLHSHFTGDAFAWYEELRAAQGSGWHAFVQTREHTVLSASPELFFMRRHGRLSTRPMKGTRPRGRWLDEDIAMKHELLASEKDRAENLMIVDLLRNDVGRIAMTGSVSVPSLFEPERYRTVWQLTSRIEGMLDDSVAMVDIFRALFPCGSVTGAPKINTMKWIAELEDSPREIYCGAIGIVQPGGDCAFNVPIRTVWIDNATGNAQYGVGSGITADSSACDELEELRAKALILTARVPPFELLETMRVEHGTILRETRHIARMGASAELFGFAFDEGAMMQRLRSVAAGCHTARVRMLLAADGTVRLETSKAVPESYADRDACRAAGALRITSIARTHVDSANPFLCNKTTHRAVYESHQAADPDAFDVLLWNERGEVTEFTTGNLVALIDGELVTPPRECGLLNGTFRQELLDRGEVRERTLTLEDVRAAERLWLVNSVRQWVEVTL